MAGDYTTAQLKKLEVYWNGAVAKWRVECQTLDARIKKGVEMGADKKENEHHKLYLQLKKDFEKAEKNLKESSEQAFKYTDDWTKLGT